jgi:hypothetical protein
MEAERRKKRDNLRRCEIRRLEDWISKLRVKRNALKRSDSVNLRVNAILNHALAEAETELKFQRLQHVKTVVPKTGFEACKDTSKDKVSNQLRDEKSKDFSDRLNNFMSELKTVKTFV